MMVHVEPLGGDGGLAGHRGGGSPVRSGGKPISVDSVSAGGTARSVCGPDVGIRQERDRERVTITGTGSGTTRRRSKQV